MNSTFDDAVALIFEHEGGLVRNPNDPGGITKYGISVAAYPHLGPDGISALTRDEAAQIYREDYWEAIKGDDMPPAVSVAVFDAAVNSGVHRSSIWLQSALNVTRDGKIGPTTIRASRSKPAVDTLSEILTLRMRFYTSLETWKHFGNGWTRRIMRTAIYCGGLID